eukprot:TRINITY_DN2463_c0_g1_i1.p1 TRINITY_DN2463_c0_g1~~TRINITY_DN2463_c0_g1_i1.p1  ORF type:complete len:158 (-),score=15.78 TRINITY_DN2463_c0_g1_i1:709-1182(-)
METCYFNFFFYFVLFYFYNFPPTPQKTNHLRSNPNDLRRPDHRVFPGDRIPSSRLVVVAARMPIRIPVLRAEQISAPAPETGQTHLLPTAQAPVHLPDRRIRRLAIQDVDDIGRLLLLDRPDGGGGLWLLEGGAGLRGVESGCKEAFLAHVLGGGVS